MLQESALWLGQAVAANLPLVGASLAASTLVVVHVPRSGVEAGGIHH